MNCHFNDSDETGRDQIFVQTFSKLGGKWQVSHNWRHTSGLEPGWEGTLLHCFGRDDKQLAADVNNPHHGTINSY